MRPFVFAIASALALLGCKPTAELEPCNIAHADCQLDIYYSLLRLRGDGSDPFGGVPPIRTLTVEQYERELRGDKPPDPPPDEQMPAEQKVDPWDVSLQLLGLIQPKMSSSSQGVTDRVNRVAAFYSGATRTVTVIDRGGYHDDRGDTILLTHELVHALQDGELANWSVHTTDSDLAENAMIEGEATLYENLTADELDGLDPQETDWNDFYGRWLSRRRSDMPNERSPYYAASWFTYPLGAGRLVKGYTEGGNAAVRHVLADPPRSAAALMLFSDDAHTNHRPTLDCKVDSPGDGYSIAGFDQFGALQIYGFLTKAGVDEGTAWKSASHVTDDRLWVFFNKKQGAVVLNWRHRYGGSKDAAELAEQLAGAEHFSAEAIDGDLLISASNQDGLLDEWPGARSCK
jgi:hypothetical protein